ncbi:hypothetical protein [Marinobacter fuscus]|uniref:hypothetical protein n=1 Tax=Marinobacter fuscus TaxID=2109942 RepID=UPI0010572E90|nr:hypothetical protein [Marinobacter fuscus]
MFSVEVSRLSGRRAGFLVLALFTLLVLQLLQFRFGYRLTADDAMFLQFIWQGWERVWAEAGAVAEFSGRIGHYAMTPLNALGALVAGSTAGRIILLLLYYAAPVLLSVYLGRLLAPGRWRVAAGFMVLVLLAVHPLAYEHMPPNAYPLQNTLPFLAVLLARLAILQWPGAHGFIRCLIYALTAGAMLVSEFVFMFATALMAVDHLCHSAWPRNGAQRTRILGLYVSPFRLLADSVVVLVALGVYLGYRWHYPSMYEGNDPSGILNPLRFFATALFHIDAGTVFHRLPGFDFAAVAAGAWLVAGVVALLTLLCASLLLRQLPLLSVRAATGVLLAGGILMFYMVAPLAATARQQQWCLEAGVCGYLDSRVAFLGFGALAYALLSLVLRAAPAQKQKPVVWVSAALLGLVAGVNYAANSVVGADMRHVVSPWGRAEAMACGAGQNAWLTDEQMSAIDPGERVSMHPQVDRRVFWLEYMNFVRRSGMCAGAAVDNPHTLNDGFYVGFTSWSSQAPGLLAGGWSAPETWGVWSNGQVSSLSLPLVKGVHDQVTALRVHFSPYFGPSVKEQAIDVLVDGKAVARWEFSQSTYEGGDCCWREIPLPPQRSGSPLTVSFAYQSLRQPGYPGEGGDVRELAIGLKSLVLLPSPHIIGVDDVE